MARGVSIEVQGMDKALKKLGALPKIVIAEVDAEMAEAANGFVNGAQADVPIDQGFTKNGITMYREGEMNYVVVSAAANSAYLEFGTRTRVQVPAELLAYASQFRNGGSKGDPKKEIYEWCKRVGIEEKYWWPVFISIMTKGIHPQPFFFTQAPIAEAKLNSSLKQVVARSVK